MDNTGVAGSINPYDVGTLSLLGGGVGYGSGRRGEYANTATLQHGLEANRQFSENSGDCTRTLFGQALNGITSSFENATRDRQFAELLKGQGDAERRVIDGQRDQDKTIEANARAAAECCCALKLQACNDKAQILSSQADDKSQILAAIAASSAKVTERELAAANAEIIYLRSKDHHGRG